MTTGEPLSEDTAAARVQGEPPDRLARSQRIRAGVASTIGTTIEWYDFFLYNTAAALIFPAVFFPETSTLTGTLDSFGTQFVGFAARPVGAAIFGHYGDRLGRKGALIATLSLMGAATALMGTQMLERYEHSRFDGVVGFWYGKGPGLDRAGDAVRHGNYAGTTRHGAVVVLSGEDHEAKSSTMPYGQEHYFVHAGMPVL